MSLWIHFDDPNLLKLSLFRVFHIEGLFYEECKHIT